MKNIILVSSTLATILMIVIINMGTKRLNQAQDESYGEVNEWMNEIDEKFENEMTAAEEMEAAKLRFSERMGNISRQQASVATDAEKSKALSDPSASLKTLIQEQTQIIHEFQRIHVDLTEQTQGIANQRHILALDNMRDSKALTHLRDIKTKLMNKQLHEAAELSRVLADQMAKWADDLGPECPGSTNPRSGSSRRASAGS
jgi:hypothetical protein